MTYPVEKAFDSRRLHHSIFFIAKDLINLSTWRTWSVPHVDHLSPSSRWVQIQSAPGEVFLPHLGPRDIERGEYPAIAPLQNRTFTTSCSIEKSGVWHRSGWVRASCWSMVPVSCYLSVQGQSFHARRTTDRSSRVPSC